MNNKFIYLDTTGQCVAKCAHCRRKVKNSFIDINTMSEIVDFAVSNGYDLELSGGEVLRLGYDYIEKFLSFVDKSKQSVTLWTNLLIKEIGKNFIDLINSFDNLVYSIDTYRLNNSQYDFNLSYSNLKKVNHKSIFISYVPFIDDSIKEIEHYYMLSHDVGAKVFYVCFFYPSSSFGIIPPQKYIEIADIMVDLQMKFKFPLFFIFNNNVASPKDMYGFMPHTCFTKGVCVTHENKVFSCGVDELSDAGLGVPLVSLQEFLQDSSLLTNKNQNFIKEFFIKNAPHKCKNCEYYSICLSGCPYFRRFSDNGVDIYCEVYKKYIRLIDEINIKNTEANQ